ncbi:Cytokinin dehydrogenase 3 [Acorus calamus]|uniref:cytokinin dehydrogenase n=1 Tax=Acorus calamus TaxID=4465 RepID=A0AAV9F4L9_ACOCL|nr:Cytokinin dehydrogenase 3 [Acorus calamus]
MVFIRKRITQMGILSRINAIVILLLLSSPLQFIQSPMDFGPLNFLQATTKSSIDFGRIVFNTPTAVLRPKSPIELSLLLKSFSAPSFSRVTVAARGAGHSIHGQAQALDGIVVEMDSMAPNIKIHRRKEGEANNGFSYADVSGGTLWVDLLKETLRHGLAPRSWTDYLYLSIGGTLSNGGISGQTFKHGPQISNVLQLDVVTGRGEAVTCSPTERFDLFNAVLGGLGQFGIITSARILLEEAPKKVKWVRVFYDDFKVFTQDQELLVSMPDKVDYVEGFVVLNEQSLHSSSVAFPSQMAFISQFHSGPPNTHYYCIEFAIHEYQPSRQSNPDQVVEEISKKLRFMTPHIYKAEVTYFDFLNRVTMEEMGLRSRGLWDVPHPWLNMFVPKSGITHFKDLLLETISPSDFEGPILIYPLLRDKWDQDTSAVLPEPDSDNVMYTVGMLRSANPDTCRDDCLRSQVRQSRDLAEAAMADNRIRAKQYLGHHPTRLGWVQHFGGKWEGFAALKRVYDPLCVLAPGQGIFERKYSLKDLTVISS